MLGLFIFGGAGLDTSIISLLVSAAAALSGIILGWTGKSRTVRQDTAADASKDALLRADMDYIKRGIEEIRLEQRAQVQRYDVLAERVTRLEESSKQAHIRINEIRQGAM